MPPRQLHYQGRTWTLVALAAHLGVLPSTLQKRLRHSGEDLDALLAAETTAWLLKPPTASSVVEAPCAICQAALLLTSAQLLAQWRRTGLAYCSMDCRRQGRLRATAARQAARAGLSSPLSAPEDQADGPHTRACLCDGCAAYAARRCTCAQGRQCAVCREWVQARRAQKQVAPPTPTLPPAVIARLRANLTRAQLRLAQRRHSYPRSHPLVRSAQTSVNLFQRQLAGAIGPPAAEEPA